MKKEYLINVKKKSHKKRNILLVVILIAIIILLLLGLYFAKKYIHSNTKINQSKAQVSTYSGSANGSLKTYSASDFSFQMPSGWTEVPLKNSEYNMFEWQTGTGAKYQTIQIFEDTIPANFAVNHVLIVQANQNQVTAIGSPSDNCQNFTNGHITSTQVGYPAKWQNVSFNCDLNNTLRDTVGTSSARAINSVTLVSPTNAHHSFFFLYTDHAVEANYGDFEQLISSFTLQ
ncbi:MAG TPA: PsbP-related protein [Candidatus Saccharimonadales bacterium]